MKILITGACGYIGTMLTNQLVSVGHSVIALDTQWFGSALQENDSLKIVKQDIRDIDPIYLENTEIVIHLANIANDPSVELNPTLSWEVNVLASQQLAEKCISSGVKQLIYASSGSVYGL